MAGLFDNWVPGTQPGGAKDPKTPALVQMCQQTAYNRQTSQDGGEIRREFIVQPASAVKSLLIALRGTFTTTNNGAQKNRIKPHADPDFPNYYCVATEDRPLDPMSVCGMASMGFKAQQQTPGATGGSVTTDLNNLRVSGRYSHRIRLRRHDHDDAQ